MNLHFAEIAKDAAPGRHARPLLDKAASHTLSKLEIPPSIMLRPLLAKCPELSPAENVRELIREATLAPIGAGQPHVQKHYEEATRQLDQAENQRAPENAASPIGLRSAPGELI
jgi:hypothetical protein